MTVGCKREVMAGGAFSLVSFLPDVAESEGEVWQELVDGAQGRGGESLAA